MSIHTTDLKISQTYFNKIEMYTYTYYIRYMYEYKSKDDKSV